MRNCCVWWTIACLAALCLALPTHAELSGLRNGATAYVRVPEGTKAALTVSYEPVWAWKSCGEYFYVQAPDGSLLARKEIPAGTEQGAEEFSLDKGPGDYRVSFSGQTYRAFALKTDPPLPMVLETAPVHMAISKSAPKVLYFRVPENTQRFSFCVKDHERRPIGLSLAPPGGGKPIRIEATEAFRGVKSRATVRQERDYFHNWDYDRHAIDGPKPGVWTVMFDRTPKVGLWLEGIPNVFAVNPDHLFVPELQPGTARIQADAAQIKGPVGTLGASFPGLTITKPIDERVRFLGLQSMCRYIGHSLREPKNDDDDPKHINWRGFNWGPDDARTDAAASWGIDQLVIIHPAKWLGGRALLKRDDRTLQEYAEFIEALIVHYNVDRGTPIKYLSLLDEPNSSYPVEDVLRLVKAVGPRLRDHPDERVRATRLMVPQSSMFFKHSAGPDRAGVFMAERIYEACDDLAGGIAWDHWTYRNLFDTWLYGEAVRRAAAIQAKHNSDGEAKEPIAIFQTNFYGGGSVTFQDTRTFYASLWWASVVAHTMKTGRMSSLNWFTTFDDPHHMKGLCYGAEKGGEIKPVGYAMKMLIETLLDDAVHSSSSHPEVDEIVTVSADRRRVTLLVVNKLPRSTTLSADIRLPEPLRDTPCRLTISQMKDGDKALQKVDDKEVKPSDAAHIERELDGETIYVFDIRREQSPK